MYGIIIFVSIFFSIQSINAQVGSPFNYEDVDFNEFISTLDIKLERHKLILHDGYIINLFRVERNNSEDLQPIILIHGIGCCVETFFMRNNLSIPHLLLNNSYDIWILSPRGTLPSLGHITLDSTKDSRYWEFGIEEIAVIDLTSSIDYVLARNEHQKVHLLGISAGTTYILISLAQVPQNREKVGLAVLLAIPASLYTNCKKAKFIPLFCENADLLPMIAKKLGINHLFLIPHKQMQESIYILCKTPMFKSLCRSVIELVLGDYEQVKDLDASFMGTRFFCGGSLRDFIHAMQIGKAGRLVRYDYGKEQNLIKYNSTEPPIYPVNEITNPLILWCGNDDMFCREPELKKFSAILPNVVSSKLVGTPIWSHTDFTLARDVNEYVYEEMLHFLNLYSRNETVSRKLS